jgi:hypothetical protein
MQRFMSSAASSSSGRAERPATVSSGASSAEQPATSLPSPEQPATPSYSKSPSPIRGKKRTSETISDSVEQLDSKRKDRCLIAELSAASALDDVDDRTEEEIYNTWRDDVESWMSPSTLAQYKSTTSRQKAHQLRRTAFSTFLFKFSKCRMLDARQQQYVDYFSRRRFA